MTEIAFEKAQTIKGRIVEAKNEYKTIKALYNKNKKEDLSEDDIQLLISLANKGNSFVQGVYEKDFREL